MLYKNTVFIKSVSLLLVFFLPILFFPSCASIDEIKKSTYKRGDTKRTLKARTHLVRKGDTLYKIARKYRVSVTDLKKLNRIRDEKDIDVGTRLMIPRAKRISRPPTRKKHKTYTREHRPKTSTRFIWPLKKFRISSRYGIRSSKKHDGIDLAAKKGTRIRSAAAGKVIFSGWGPSGYGKVVILKHAGNAITVYAHNDRNLVRKGARVGKGQSIATVGKSGRATGYHVHFEIRIKRKPVNPEKYLPRL
ncbi:Peptidase, M23/M37 family [hydrothermal vent metagenome]|uniref:Peptidase, M23/M37 family n=1 Tax=hydrothermal vent metagenome TaxID=652676 RepID=A0A3B1D1Z1_9ZZZZ